MWSTECHTSNEMKGARLGWWYCNVWDPFTLCLFVWMGNMKWSVNLPSADNKASWVQTDKLVLVFACSLLPPAQVVKLVKFRWTFKFRLTNWFLFPSVTTATGTDGEASQIQIDKLVLVSPLQPLPSADGEASQVQTSGRIGWPAAGGQCSIALDTAGIVRCWPLCQSAQHKPKHIIATAVSRGQRTSACYSNRCLKRTEDFSML